VQRLVEVLRRKETGDAVERLVVDEDRTQQGLFRIDVVRSFAIGEGLFAAGCRLELVRGKDL